MLRIVSIALIIFLASCSRRETHTRFVALEEYALSMAAAKCQSGKQMDWLLDVIKLTEQDLQYKGSIYAIASSQGTMFLVQPWMSNCYGCRIYDCEGDTISLDKHQQSEILAEAKEENIIYTSAH